MCRSRNKRDSMTLIYEYEMIPNDEDEPQSFEIPGIRSTSGSIHSGKHFMFYIFSITSGRGYLGGESVN
jgi:hypothetical protein